jgi:type I restriction enzyme S subunit
MHAFLASRPASMASVLTPGGGFREITPLDETQPRRRLWEEAELAKMRAKGKVPRDDRWKARYVEPESVNAEGLPELPEGWVWAKVEQTAFVNLGRQRSPKNHNGPHMRPYLRAANVTWTGIDISDIREMNFDPIEVTGYLLEPGDILLSEGSGSASEVGKPAIFRGEISGCCFQNTLVRVRCSISALVEWLHLHFLRDALFGHFASLSRGIGIHHIGRDSVSQWPIAIPPLEEQQRILEIVGHTLGAADATRDKINATTARLTPLHQSLLAQAFRGELVPQDPEDEPASVLLERIRKERAAAEKAGKAGNKKRARKAR